MKQEDLNDSAIDISVKALLSLKGNCDDEDTAVPTLDNVVQAKKKKRVRRHTKTIEDFLRPPVGYVHLPNSDVRFTYPSQLVNIVNGMDMLKFSENMRNICDPNVQLIQDFGGVKDPIGPNRKVLCGVEALIAYVSLTASATPDLIITLDKKVVGYYDRSTNEAHIQFTLLGKCTMVCRVVESSPQASNTNNSTEVVSDDDEKDVDNVHLNDNDALDNITTSFGTFNLEPIRTPLQKTVFVSRMAVLTNSEGKIHTWYKRVTKVD